MTKNLDKEGLRVIAENYDLFYIDIWGVIHNGIELHQKAILALNQHVANDPRVEQVILSARDGIMMVRKV